jgi:hypothetical protein
MPIEFLLAALAKIMWNNIFQFDDTFWKQKRGCVMGTSSAVNYACLYVGLLEVRRSSHVTKTIYSSSKGLLMME